MRKILAAFLALLLSFSPAFAIGGWVWEGGAWHAIQGPYTYQSGSYHAIVQGWTWQSGAWHLMLGQLHVSANNINTSVSGISPSFFVSGSSTASPTGGSGSYTYLWTYVSGDAGITPDNATLQSPTFGKTIFCGPGSNCPVTASWKVTVTDTVTSLTANATISIALEYDRN